MRHTLTLLFLLTSVALAADPPPGVLTRGFRQYGPKADAFALGSGPYFRAEIERQSGPFRRGETAVVADTYEVLFLARTRPVRIRVSTKVAGQTLSARFETHLKELFAAFDRDGDGSLNRYEAELIFSRSEFQQMLRGGFGFRGQNGKLPTIDILDRDNDGRVSYEEFADYYLSDAVLMTQVRSLVGEVRGVDQLTTELFARLDTNQDGRLSEAELKAAEKILGSLDADEDETVSTFELLANTATRNNLLGGAAGGDGMMMGMNPNRPGVTSSELEAHLGPLPKYAIPLVIKRYDTDRDQLLTRKEIELPKAVFDQLDANKDGKLDATELEAWRTGEPDVKVTLICGDKPTDCTAEAVAGQGGEGVEVPKPLTPDRIVLRVGPQTIDLSAVPLPDSARNNQNPYAYLFPADKKFLEEKDLIGPQYQFLRVAFDPADFDGDGKLTREEFDRYFLLQIKTTRLGFALSHSIRVPNLFQLLDGSGDGKLGVKELRTAYSRLIPLEPSGEQEVTRQILQPSAMIRFGHASTGVPTANVVPQPVGMVNRPAPQPAEGPIWFRKMDRNADGDVSRAEFLGSKEDFDMLDTNKDGLISLEEVTAFEQKARPKK